MLCPQCGYENKDAASVCNLCGALLRRADGSAATPKSASASSSRDSGDDIFPNPTALNADPNAPLAPTMFEDFDARREKAAHQARYWLVGGGALIVLALAVLVITRLPYSPSTVDAMYADYVAAHPNSNFPEPFYKYQTYRKESAEYIFQFVHAYEQTFVDDNPYEKVYAQSEDRLAAANAGEPDPGLSDAPATDDSQQKTLDRINDAESVATNLYGAGSKPFDTLRSLAGNDERGRERRDLEMELVSGKKESQIRTINMERSNRIQHYKNLEQMTREELQYFIQNGTPKLRSIAQRLNERLFGGSAKK